MLLSVPMLGRSQVNDDWKLYFNHKQIASSKADAVQTVAVHKTDTATLRFEFAAADTAFKRKIVVMNEQRNGIDSKQLTANAIEAVFSIAELYHQSNGKDLTFYIVNTPADPAKAALVRVAPKPICKLQWVE